MQTATVAVLTATLAQNDRRVLSQAWYSALHLAERTPAHPATLRTCAPGPEIVHPNRGVANAAEHTVSGPVQNACRRSRTVPVAALPLERRGPANGLGRRIARILVRRAGTTPTQAAAVRVRGGRVHLIVRTQGGVTRIVALCPAAIERRVAQALAHARFGLAAGGARMAGS